MESLLAAFVLASYLLLPAAIAVQVSRFFFQGGGWWRFLLAALCLYPLVIYFVLMALSPFGVISTVPVLGVMWLLAVLGLGLRRGGGAMEADSEEGLVAALNRASPESFLACALLAGAWLYTATRVLGHGSIFFSDDYAYHGPVVTQWLLSGTLSHEMVSFADHYPFNPHVMTLYLALPTGDFRWAWMVNLYWLTVGALTILSINRVWPGARLAFLALAAALFLLCREVSWFGMGMTSTDIIGTVSMLAAFVLLVPRRQAPPRELAGSALVAGLMIGFAVGTKVNFVIPAAFAFAFGLFILSRRVWNPERRWRSILPIALSLSAGTLATGSYWYIRNAILTDNPVFPVRIWFLRGPGTPHVFHDSKLSTFIASDPTDMTLWGSIIFQMVDWPVAFGLISLLGIMMALWFSARRVAQALRRRSFQPLETPAPWMLAGALALFAVYPSMPYSGAHIGSTNLEIANRYFLFLFVVGVVSATWFVSLLPHHRLPSRSLVFALSAVLVFNWPKDSEGLLSMLLSLILWSAFVVTRRESWARVGAFSYRWATPVLVILIPVSLFVRDVLVEGPYLNFRIHREAIGFREVLEKLDTLEAGSRIAQFDINSWETWHLYGPRLNLVPVQVDANGNKMRPLYRAYIERRERPFDALGVPAQHNLRNPGELVDNLRSLHIDHVLINRWSTEDPWPPQREILQESPFFRVIFQNPYSELYQAMHPDTIARHKGEAAALSPTR